MRKIELKTTMVWPVLLALLIISLQSCSKTSRTQKTSYLPEWATNTVIYEVNVRQYTPEGTFNAFSQHLQRLSDLGVDILWIMPINPIGEKNRKGSLGSYYSVKDYQKVNPDFGTLDDFKKLVDKAHQLKMKVIIDWVANHSAWDNPWITEHPDWYAKDSLGNLISPYDWTDVAQLNYKSEGLNAGMIDAMKFWVTQTDIDGFRCDVAGMVPVTFWDMARAELQQVKPIFMLAEDESKTELLINAFNANYGWSMHACMNQVAKGNKNASDIKKLLITADTTYTSECFPMQFTSNHDENSWNGTEYERMGKAAPLFAVLTFTMPGMPLIYSGQEAALSKRLRFFDKDTISWDDYSMTSFYQQLTTLKHQNKALANGHIGGHIEFIETSQPEKVLSFSRMTDSNKVITVFNCSADTVTVSIPALKDHRYLDYFKQISVDITTADWELTPWQYHVFVE